LCQRAGRIKRNQGKQSLCRWSTEIVCPGARTRTAIPMRPAYEASLARARGSLGDPLQMGRPKRQRAWLPARSRGKDTRAHDDPRSRDAGASIPECERPSPRGRRCPRSGALERLKVIFFCSLDRSDLPRTKQFRRSGAPLFVFFILIDRIYAETVVFLLIDRIWNQKPISPSTEFRSD
jgi:hypothetical protein